MDLSSQTIAIIGCGNLGQAIVHGLLDSGRIPAGQIYATRRHLEHISDLEMKGVITTTDNRRAVQAADVVIMAVKPYNMTPILTELRSAFRPGEQVVISLATGYSLDDMKGAIRSDVTVFRAMPNTATDVRESMTCISYEHANDHEIGLVNAIFGTLGSAITIDENLMEAATVLGACGVAYVLRFIRAMIQGGIQIGFDANTATAIVNQTVKGSASLLITRNEHPEHEIDKVTTPKGCTIVGLNEMEHNGFSSSLIRGIVTSYRMIEKP